MLLNKDKTKFLARKYADAIYFLAIEKKKYKIFNEQFLKVIDIYNQNTKNSNLSNIKNKKIFIYIAENLKNYIDICLYNFLFILIQSNRYNLINNIYCCFLQKNNKINIKVFIPLFTKKDVLDNIKSQINKKFKQVTTYDFIYDNSLLGGIIIKYNNIVINNSIINNLLKLKIKIIKK